MLAINWSAQTHSSISYKCYACGNQVASSQGYQTVIHEDDYRQNGTRGDIRICHFCGMPSFFLFHFHRTTSDDDWKEVKKIQVPSPAPGNPVEHLPDDVSHLYKEARVCITANAYTPAVLAFRKILMHVAVEKGADEGKKFAFYVDYLNQQNILGAGAKVWVDKIRAKGNEATHELVHMTQDDATDMLNYTEMLLRMVYEFPEKAK